MSAHFQSCNVNSIDPNGPDAVAIAATAATATDLKPTRNMIYLFIYYWKYIIKCGGGVG